MKYTYDVISKIVSYFPIFNYNFKDELLNNINEESCFRYLYNIYSLENEYDLLDNYSDNDSLSDTHKF